ncbi:MAG: hypothetical protein IJ760_07320 [Bacteroidales bacterium]|nr:hypothetical protein [Bacteroidales bacterium]
MAWYSCLLLAALAVMALLYARLATKNRRLRRLAEEAERLRLQAEATEQRNRQLKQEMTSNIAHELKTPVSSIRGYLEIMLGGVVPLTDESRQRYLERCFKQTMRLSHLIEDVSLINKLEESADLFPKRRVDVAATAAEAFGDLADVAAQASITLENNLPPMPAEGSPELLYSIFRNLAENAVRYAGTGARVAVEEYKPAAGHYYLRFYDTGVGVPDEYLLRLFDRFVRIDQGRSRRDGGTGLGLSIVKHAVLFHGGEIYARNREGGGLEFYFSLRREPAPAAASTAKTPARQ